MCVCVCECCVITVLVHLQEDKYKMLCDELRALIPGLEREWSMSKMHGATKLFWNIWTLHTCGDITDDGDAV